MSKFYSFLLITIFFFTKSGNSQTNKALTYLALGDSYTIGEKVTKSKRWPVQLVKALNDSGLNFQQPKIIAKTGWRTDDLLAAIKKNPIQKKFDLVSLLIGVNNQYQDKPLSQFKAEFTQLLQIAIEKSKNAANGAFVVSIPDYSVTPFIEKKKEKIRKEINTYNVMAKSLAREYNVKFINITPISRKAKTDTSLVAKDALHPSGKMYAEWVQKIKPAIKSITHQ